MTPICSYFGTCGGCRFQNLKYPEDQIEFKKKYLEEILEIKPEIIASPYPYEYRNRMDFVCAFSKTGLRQKGKFDQVVDIDKCYIINKRVSDVLIRLKQIIQDEKIATYNYITHKGYLRYIIFRYSLTTDQMMINFVTKTKNNDILSPLIEEASKHAVSVNWIVNEGLGDRSFGEIYKYFKNIYITEKIGSYTYMLGPNSFFQNNSYLTYKLFDEIKKYVSGKTLDAYCGVGAISIYIADKADSVFGIELEQEAISFASQNAVLNNISNASFTVSDTRQWFIKNPDIHFDTIIIDPPRSGIGGKVAKKLLKNECSKIIYVSCNPKSFMEDYKFLKSKYSIQSIKGFDMFPQTPHIECVFVLTKN